MKLKLFVVVLLLFSCNDEPNVPTRKLPGKVGVTGTVNVIEIDDCEYIFIDNGNASWGAHKGNCRFCLSRRISNGF